MKEISKRRSLGSFRFFREQASSRDESAPPSVDEYTLGMDEAHRQFLRELVERMRTAESDEDFTYFEKNERFQIHVNRVIGGELLELNAEGTFL